MNSINEILKSYDSNIRPPGEDGKHLICLVLTQSLGSGPVKVNVDLFIRRYVASGHLIFRKI